MKRILIKMIQALIASSTLALAACGGGGGGCPADGSASPATLALVGCGGGGGGGSSSSPPASTTAEGLWNGSTSTSRTVTGIVLDNGTYWVLYSSPNNSAVIAGAVQGTGTSLNGSFSSSDAKDFNLEGQGINNATVSASYNAKQSFNGAVTYSSPTPSVTFTSTYNPAYEQTPSLTSVAGTYFGTAAVVGGTESATVVVTSTGQITGIGISGCQFSGTATPHPKGNVFDLAVTFGGGVCSNGTSTVTGIGYFDATQNRLYSTALNSARSNGFIFVGTKP